MKYLLVLDGRTESGGSPLLCHNERLSDPLDEMTRDLGALTKKTKKTEADHLEISRVEFLGGLYTNGNGPCLPGMNVLRCLQDGAKRHKRGIDVIRGVYPLVEHADIQYEGTRDPEEMWQAGLYLRKGVVISGRRTMRTRPLFVDWRVEVPIEVDATVFDLDTLRQCWREAGIYAGIGDNRPINGRFAGTIEEAKS